MFGRLVSMGVLAVVLASAQRGGGGGGGGDEMGGMGGGGGRAGGGDMGATMSAMTRKPTKAEQMADKLKLSKEQREEAVTILSAALERSGSVRAEMDDRRAKIAGALIDGKTGDELSKLTADYAEVAAKMTKVEADAFAKIYALLKPNQQGKADQAFELMAGIFSGSGGGGRGAGGGQGRGMGGNGRSGRGGR